MVERQQIEAYTALIREIGDQDVVTRQMLIGILAETEQHASELADYLKRTADTKLPASAPGFLPPQEQRKTGALMPQDCSPASLQVSCFR